MAKNHHKVWKPVVYPAGTYFYMRNQVTGFEYVKSVRDFNTAEDTYFYYENVSLGITERVLKRFISTLIPIQFEVIQRKFHL
jgi:hypothetical protein